MKLHDALLLGTHETKNCKSNQGSNAAMNTKSGYLYKRGPTRKHGYKVESSCRCLRQDFFFLAKCRPTDTPPSFQAPAFHSDGQVLALLQKAGGYHGQGARQCRAGPRCGFLHQLRRRSAQTDAPRSDIFHECDARLWNPERVRLLCDG